MNNALITLTTLSAMLLGLPGSLRAQIQEPSSPTRASIRVVLQDTGGLQSRVVDTTLNWSQGFSLDTLLRSLGLQDPLAADSAGSGDLEIIINQYKNLGEGLQGLRLQLNELMPDLRGIVPDLQGLQSMLRDVQEGITVFQANRPGNKALLGIYYDQQEYPEGWYARVTEVLPASAAERAGLQAGDQVLSVNGVEVGPDRTLTSLLQPYAPGDTVELGFRREGAQSQANAVLGSQVPGRAFRWQNPESAFEFQWDGADLDLHELPFSAGEKDLALLPQRPFLGVFFDYEDRGGLVISGTVSGSTADSMGFMRGDRILAINNREVQSVAELKALIASLPIGERVEVRYEREGQQGIASAKLRGNRESMRGAIKLQRGLQGAMGNLEEMIQQQLRQGNFAIPPELLADLEKLRNLEDLEIFFSRDSMELDRASVAQLLEEIMDEMPQRVERRVELQVRVEPVSADDLNGMDKKTRNQLRAGDDLELEHLSVSPNPSDGPLLLRFALAEPGPVDVGLYDESGRLVFSRWMERVEGEQQLHIDLFRESGGVYYLRLSRDRSSATRKVVLN
jgi:hypothetical protein